MKKNSVKAKKPKRKRSKATGRKAGKQPLKIGESTHRIYARLPDSEAKLMEERRSQRADSKSVADYLRKLIKEDCARLKAS